MMPSCVEEGKLHELNFYTFTKLMYAL